MEAGAPLLAQPRDRSLDHAVAVRMFVGDGGDGLLLIRPLRDEQRLTQNLGYRVDGLRGPCLARHSRTPRPPDKVPTSVEPSP